MRGSKAKVLRKLVYGKDDFRVRSYVDIPTKKYSIGPSSKDFKTEVTTFSDSKRRTYQKLKEASINERTSSIVRSWQLSK